MANAMIDGDLPPRWGLKQVTPDKRILWIGPKRIALDDIRSVNAQEVRERPVQGLMIGATVFMLAAVILAFGVFENGWRDRFLLGTLFLGFLGLAGLTETIKIRAQRFFEVKIATGSQGLVTFASANAREVEDLLAALAAAGVKA